MKTADRIRELISLVENNEYTPTKYFTVTDINQKNVKIRVGNHSANRFNNDEEGRTLSFVTNKNTPHSSYRKQNMLYDEYLLVDGDPVENWNTLEELLQYNDIEE
ncbi:MAG: hypothetical protein LBS23_02045 [Holosporaceae bacterium]|jgi:hypothetical protein|nr:hypothetical protein [Holosporaceae bacterium]